MQLQEIPKSVFRLEPPPLWYVTNGELTVGPVVTGLLMRGVEFGWKDDVDEHLEAIHPLAPRQEALLTIELQAMRVGCVDDLVAAKLEMASAGAVDDL